ncbi:unnamed protein product [Porites lobata]|uniref:G-protein coupled receptors family 1 profile domain-containing protein n=1 Tax=Porites lobata TaxID=104759 RepID=A0ABN8RH21_9CNID|nr:unnamed protein product [Porites lobata]
MFSRTVLLNFLEPSLNTFYIIDFFALTVVFLNSLLNPVIYCIRIRQFRVAMIELTFRNVTSAKAEEMEMQWFGAKNVTKSRLRAQKSNIVFAMLALTDLLVGILAQPIFIDRMISILLQESNGQSCLTEILSFAISNCLFTSSLLHLALASGERYVAIKYPYQHITIVTESRLLVASLPTWLLAVVVHVALAVDTFLFYRINNIVIGLSFAVIIFCHFSVYIETRRHAKQVAAQQVTQEARKQFEKDKKAFKLTSTIIGVLLLCYSPLMFCRLFLVIIYTPTLNTFYIIGFFAVTVVYLNSLLNPVIYCIRIRQFRVAFIELTFRNVNVARAEEMERQWFGAQNVVVGREAEHYQGRPE